MFALDEHIVYFFESYEDKKTSNHLREPFIEGVFLQSDKGSQRTRNKELPIQTHWYSIWIRDSNNSDELNLFIRPFIMNSLNFSLIWYFIGFRDPLFSDQMRTIFQGLSEKNLIRFHRWNWVHFRLDLFWFNYDTSRWEIVFRLNCLPPLGYVFFIAINFSGGGSWLMSLKTWLNLDSKSPGWEEKKKLTGA